ncbi:type I secretion outer membrane protein, TolC family [Moraxella lacunata]|uniref:Type I secretion outer membrane protein, TolC family n=1 Tax=Moraxella lacunata TaxID=477 RepID=A0A378TUE2_MORLA|nr:TolC family protein [Moraxella lacunata]STZ64241.1 type I secretion outer membrane protein, TolC family [Moraxella lacunata]
MIHHNLKKCLLLGLGLLPVLVSADINPLDLDALLIRATQTHPLVNAAKADEMAAVEGMKAAKLGLLPAPTISAGHDKDDGLVSTIAIRQPLWTGGRLTAQINQSIYDNKAANAYVFEQQNTVAKNTIDIWRGYIYAVALQELYADSLARLKEFEAMMERRVAQGVSAKIELDLVKNRIYQDQNSLQNAIEQERVAAARLSQLIGEELGEKKYNITMKSLTDYAKAQSVNFETQVFGNSGSHHPSVVRQHFQVEAAKQEAKAQAAGRYPNIYAQYQHTFEHDNNEDEGEFSLGMSYDPGAGFSSLALTRAANARAMSLTQTQEATRRTVMEGLQTQYQEFTSARDREQSIKLAIDGAKLVVDSYGRQFIAGRKSWLEVLNAVREHTQYEQQLLEVQSQMVASFYKLQVDFGAMDWQSEYGSIHAPVSEFRPYRTFLAWRKTNAQPTPKLSTPMADGSFVNQQNLWIEPPRLADELGNEMDEIDEIYSSDAQMEHIIDGEGVQMGEQIQPVDERRFPTADDFK